MSFFISVILYSCGLLVVNAATGLLLNKAAGLMGSYWPNPSNIVVCWETSGYSIEKMAVQSAIRGSWEAHSALRFTNWDDCDSGDGDIRIEIADSHPGVQGLGTQVRNVPGGMLLNFRFETDEFANGTFYKWCRRQLIACIKIIAIHEFGHAIGLAHEQNRADAPANCHMLHQGTVPDHLITVYDPHSVMNYCSRRVGLSRGDIDALKILYSAKEGNCTVFQNRKFSIQSGQSIAMHGYRADQCCGLCSIESKCKAFNWHQRDGGTCYLETAISNLTFAPGYICGVSKTKRCESQNIYIYMGQVLVSRGWRNDDQIRDMNYENRRNTIIVELKKVTDNTIGQLQLEGTIIRLLFPQKNLFQGMSTAELLRLAGCSVGGYNRKLFAEMGEILVTKGWVCQNQIEGMTQEDRRNTIIVKLNQMMMNKTISQLQAMQTTELLRMAGNTRNLFVKMGEMLVRKSWRNENEMRQINYEDRRNSIIVELNLRTDQTIIELQAMSTVELLSLAEAQP